MPSAAMMIRVMTDAPTNDHVAIWNSMRGLGVGSGVVVTGTINTDAYNQMNECTCITLLRKTHK